MASLVAAANAAAGAIEQFAVNAEAIARKTHPRITRRVVVKIVVDNAYMQARRASLDMERAITAITERAFSRNSEADAVIMRAGIMITGIQGSIFYATDERFAIGRAAAWRFPIDTIRSGMFHATSAQLAMTQMTPFEAEAARRLSMILQGIEDTRR